jgi:transposase
MRKIREVLRLRLGQGLSQRVVARSVGLSQGAVHGYVARAGRAGLAWPLPEGLDDGQLEALLYPAPPDLAADRRPVPDWAVVHREVRRPNVTLALSAHGNGSTFARRSGPAGCACVGCQT